MEPLPLLATVGPLVVALWACAWGLDRRDRRIAQLESLATTAAQIAVTVNERRPLPPPAVPRGTPYFGGRLPTRLERPTEAVPILGTAEQWIDLEAWEAEVAGLPVGHMADGSLATFAPDGTLRPIHPTQARRIYRPSACPGYRAGVG